MKPAGRVNMTEWRAAASQLARTSSRELPDFLNGQALFVASQALKLTHRADKAKMEAQLGQVATAVKRGPRTGRFRKTRGGYRLLTIDSLAARILKKRLRLTGRWGIRGDTLIEKAANLIAAKARSVNFIRSGWIPAIKILSGHIYKRPRKVTVNPVVSGGKQYGQPKGSARLALFGGERWSTTITNTALNTLPKPPQGIGNPLRYGEEGLARALRVAAADMRAEFERRMRRTFDLFSGKRR